MFTIDRPCAMMTEMPKLTTHPFQHLEQSDPSMPRDADFARLSCSRFICFLVNSPPAGFPSGAAFQKENAMNCLDLM